MVALQARRLRVFAVSEALPSQHAFANVNPTIVDQIRLHHVISARIHDFRNRISQ